MLDMLEAAAREHGVTLKLAALPDHLRGLYIPTKGLILINQRLNASQRCAAAAHELGHAHYGHGCDSERAEAQAWKYAAGLLVDAGEYARAEGLCAHPAAIAAELGVTVRVVLEWQRHYGQAVQPAISG